MSPTLPSKHTMGLIVLCDTLQLLGSTTFSVLREKSFKYPTIHKLSQTRKNRRSWDTDTYLIINNAILVHEVVV